MKRLTLFVLAGLIILFVLGWYIDSIVHAEIVLATQIILGVVTFSVIILAIALLIFAFLVLSERFLTERANRKLAQTQSNVMVVKAHEGEQVYIRDIDKQALWRNAHLDARTYANGQQTLPTQAEIIAWQTWALRNNRLPNTIDKVVPQLLPPMVSTDLLTELDNIQRCLIVGASDSGKTTLLKHIVKRRTLNSEVVVIDPHASPSKWQGCKVAGLGRNYEEIDKVLNALVRVMTKRYDEIGKGVVIEGQHTPLTIIIDEWRAIVKNCGKAAGEAIGDLLTESRKAAFSVFVATHSERAKPLGLEGEYDLKDGFTIVRLSIVNGVRQATIDKGNGEVQVNLPSPNIGQIQPVIEMDELINMEVEPDPFETEILDLWDSGVRVKAEISDKVFGSKGGNQYKKIQEVLEKFNRI